MKVTHGVPSRASTGGAQTGNMQSSADLATAQRNENAGAEQVTSKDDQETNADNVKIDEEGRGLLAKVSRRLGRSGTSSSDSSSSKAQELDFGDADKGDKE